MDIKDIKKIIGLMKANELAEFEMEDEGFRIAIKRGNGHEGAIMVSPPQQAPMMIPQQQVPQMSGGADVQAGAPPAKDENEGLVEIKSPMVGTFYRSSSPETEAFASVGDAVDEDTVVCIIEAMKVMNEIKAEAAGVIRKILVENATAVEFGQPLFLIEPA